MNPAFFKRQENFRCQIMIQSLNAAVVSRAAAAAHQMCHRSSKINDVLGQENFCHKIRIMLKMAECDLKLLNMSQNS